jgi:lipopolysaccharide export system ATP-binding protein
MTAQAPIPLVLSAQHLRKAYRGMPVVRDVSLHVRTGEVVGLLGPNGAGKTTSFSMITGLISSDSGQVFLGHLDLSDLPMYMRARAGIRYLPQDASIFRGLNVEDNLLAIIEMFYDEKAKREEVLQQLLDEFQLNDIRLKPAKVLSGGERRRVEIARSLVGGPRFLLFDEPLAGIDPKMMREIRTLIKKLKKKGLGILITEHNVRETLAVVDRAYIISGGTILKEGTPQEIVNDEVVQETYLGSEFTF